MVGLCSVGWVVDNPILSLKQSYCTLFIRVDSVASASQLIGLETCLLWVHILFEAAKLFSLLRLQFIIHIYHVHPLVAHSK